MGNIIWLNVSKEGIDVGQPTVFDVANYFLRKVDIGAGSAITPLKLQKLVYYAQAWSLALDNIRLFDGVFQAWVHGPVNVELYNKYERYRWDSIEPPTDVSFDMFTDQQISLMDEVWEAYGKYDGKYLEDLTHQEVPWLKAREGLLPGERCDRIINENLMKEYYRSLCDNEEEKN